LTIARCLQHFCESAFALELTEYQDEGVRYDGIAYRGKHPLVKLLGNELMTLLDEQCRLPHPTDHKLLTKLYKKYGAAQGGVAAIGAHGKAVRMEENDYTDQLFRVTHYATQVTYSVAGFLEKHFDEVPEAVERMLVGSTSVVLNTAPAPITIPPMSARSDASSVSGRSDATGLDGSTRSTAAGAYLASTRSRQSSTGPATPVASVKRAQNVNLGTLVRAQLTQLLEELNHTVPHFVRCFKASDRPLRTGTPGAPRRETEAGSTATAGSYNPLLRKTRRSTAGDSATTAAAATAAGTSKLSISYSLTPAFLISVHDIATYSWERGFQPLQGAGTAAQLRCAGGSGRRACPLPRQAPAAGFLHALSGPRACRPPRLRAAAPLPA
jgi:hypothetical protein